MYHTYVLELSDGSYYIGSTRDLEQRLSAHNKGMVKSTRKKLPCRLLYQETYRDRSEAQSREYQIKKWKSRAAVERLFKKQ